MKHIDVENMREYQWIIDLHVPIESYHVLCLDGFGID